MSRTDGPEEKETMKNPTKQEILEIIRRFVVAVDAGCSSTDFKAAERIEGGRSILRDARAALGAE